MKIVDENFISNTYTAIALGFFDGIHLGHQTIINKAVSEGKNGLSPCIFTFKENPSNILSDKPTPYILDNPSKEQIFSSLGTEFLIEADFKNIMNISAADFVYKFLHKRLKAKKIFCGFNFTFGQNGNGNTKILVSMCKNLGIEVFVASPIKTDNNEIISSSKIRQYIQNCEISKANKMLGRNFSFCLEVVRGNQIGRTWGYPTANQIIPANIVQPKYGVYISSLTFKKYKTYGITNIGFKPTIGSSLPLIESHMPFYHGDDIYGELMTTELIKFIRPEKKFNNIDFLKQQIKRDNQSLIDFLNQTSYEKIQTF